MKWVTAYRNALHVQVRHGEAVSGDASGFIGSLAPHAIHELLFDPVSGDAPPLFPALMAARAAAGGAASRTLVWIDPAGTFYPPAAMGGAAPACPLDVLRPRPTDLTWAAVECLRCKQVGAVVAMLMERPTRVEVRRLQLAAERGGGVGVLLRPSQPRSGSDVYAATTRWQVSPAPGERTIQRWRVRQIHGQGWQTRPAFLLEKHRASGRAHFVYPPAPVAHHPLLPAAS